MNFTNESLYIDPNINDFKAYNEMIRGSFDLWKHQYKDRYSVCKEVAAIIEGEFFMQTNGQLVFKPPYYNMNPGVYYKRQEGNTTRESYEVINGDQYLIEDKEIISYNSAISDAQIANWVYVKGQVEYLGALEIGLMNTSFAFDYRLMNQFGFRSVSKDLPILGSTQDEQARVFYAKGILNRRNANYNTMNMQIAMRPELKLGRTIAMVGNLLYTRFNIRKFNPFNPEDNSASLNIANYLRATGLQKSVQTQDKETEDIEPREQISNILVYYISGITHSWSPGTVCTTNLILTHGRYWENYFGVLNYVPREEVLLDFEDEFTRRCNNELISQNEKLRDSQIKMQNEYSDVKDIKNEGDISSKLNSRGYKSGTSDYTSKSAWLGSQLIAKRSELKKTLETEIKKDVCITSIALYVENDRTVPTTTEVADRMIDDYPGYDPALIRASILSLQTTLGLGSGLT